MMLSEEDLNRLEDRAKTLMDYDRKYQWRETINIVGYDVFECGVNQIPRLIKEIRRLRKSQTPSPSASSPS